MDWKDVVRTVAPGLATAAGGPAAGLAIKILSDKLLGRDDATQEQVEAVVNSGLDNTQLLALKQGEQQLALELAKLNAATESAYLADTAGARSQTADLARSGSAIAWGAPVVSIMVVLGYFACIWLLFIRGDDLPVNLAQLVSIMFGALQLGFGQVINYWLGSSAGSKKSGDAIREIATRKGS